MREVFLPQFALPVPFSERQISLDLVEVNVEGLSIRGDAETADRVLRRLNELKVSASDGTEIPLFNKPHKTLLSGRREAKVTRAGEEKGGKKFVPIISGKVVMRRGRDPTATYSRSRDLTSVSLRLKINLARFLSAQSFRTLGKNRRIVARKPFALAYVDEYQVEGDEIAFGRDGNVVIGTSRVYEYALSKSPIAHLQDLLRAIVETIASWIEERLDPVCNRLQQAVSYSLCHVEWYAEFEAHDPRRIVARLIPVLTRQGKKSNVFRRRLTGQVKQFGPHSHSMQIERAVGKRQTTYSKTSRRVRFEVKYRRSSFHGIFGRRTGLSQAALYEALDLTRINAVRELTTIFRAIGRQVETFPSAKTRDDLCLVIGAHSESLGCAEEILRSLRQSGAVMVEHKSILRPSIDRLTDAKVAVLRHVRHAVYTVTDEFEMALRELMSQPGAEQGPQGGKK